MRRTFRQLRWCLLLLTTLCVVAPKDAAAKPGVQTARIEITAQGYQPAGVKLRRGARARVTFVRTTDATCAKEVVLPGFNIRRALPLNQPVVVTSRRIRKEHSRSRAA